MTRSSPARAGPSTDSTGVLAYADTAESTPEGMGTRELYLAAGFYDVDAPDGTRPVMRRDPLAS